MIQCLECESMIARKTYGLCSNCGCYFKQSNGLCSNCGCYFKQSNGENVMTRSEKLKEIEALKARIAEIESSVERLLPEDIGGFRIYGSYGKFYGQYARRSQLEGQNHFPDLPTARAYAEAFSTMIELRRQHGTVPPSEDVKEWTICFSVESGDVVSTFYEGIFAKITRLAPMFATGKDAENAIQAVGKDKIIRMFKTFHHLD